MPIATSLCPDELDNHGEEDADAVFAEDEEVEDSLPWSSVVYLPRSTFHRSKTLISLTRQGMKFVKRGGTMRRNSGRVHLFKITLQVIFPPGLLALPSSQLD